MRNLQSLLSERDDEVKTLQGEKSRLEIDSESLQQRLKTLDESEHRYKEENWNLETRMQEINSLQKETADREKKLNQALAGANAEKSTAQKELDEVKASHAKLSEDHAAAVKHHDIELGTARRNLAMAEEELSSLQRKVEDLTNQNQELAKAYSAQRGRMLERDPASGLSDEEFETATDNVTPEHSPPPSPVKGTPRHAVLETETVKSSLHHAQRTIQSQRSQLHREKTEKLELRRIIQDLRDDLEKARNDAGGPGANRRSRKVDSKEFKRPSKLLGSMRSGRHDIFMDDPEWEDKENASPSGSPTAARKENILPTTESSDQFDTANEASESAFETANERATGTETDDFQTGNEAMSDSDGAETETESKSRGFGKMKKPPSLPAGLAKAGNRESFHSTASTSADEDVLPEMQTPTVPLSSQRSRFRLSRMFSRSSRQGSEEPNTHSSRQGSEEPSMRGPPSIASSNDTPRAAGQSLFAELQDFEGSDEESLRGTPDRRLRSVTPGSAHLPPKPAMVDSSTMTDPVSVSVIGAEESKRPGSSVSVINTNRDSADWRSSYATATDTDASRPLSTVSYSDAGAQSEEFMHEKLEEFPVPPKLPTWPDLDFTPIQTQHIEPREATYYPPPLSLSSIISEDMAPVEIPVPVPRPLSLAPIATQVVEPVEEEAPTPKVVPVAAEPSVPELSLSSILAQNILPTPAARPSLSYSGISAQQSTPVFDPLPTSPSLTFSSIIAQYTEPLETPTPSTRLSLSSITTESVEPQSAPRQRPPSLTFSVIQSVEVRPQSPRNWRDGFILPRDAELPDVKNAAPETPNKTIFGSFFGFGKSKDVSPPVIAEDETRQSPSDSPNAETPESQKPFREISTNSSARPPRKASIQTSDQGAQTALTGGAIEKLVNQGPRKGPGHQKSNSTASIGSPDTIGTVRIHRSQESLSSHFHAKGADDSMQDGGSVIVRRDSASSAQAPPLPSNHRQMIQAARSGSSSGAAQGNMGPPLWPASAMRQRPSTPSHRAQTPDYTHGTPTPRAARTGGLIDNMTQKKHAMISRQSSMSSFASEIDSRFNIRPGEFDPTGFGPHTDPRMIQAITQTMIGEFLWKYTRKTGRGELSDNRHRRYFWVHPYTRTLYWSERDPSTGGGRAELKAKSVPIEAVRVVTDDNPMPPGLHRKSLVVISPGRTIKFTCPTGQRHETWFNSLSYLLIRTEPQAVYDAEDVTDSITREDIDEFNPQFGRRPARGTRPAAGSMSSYTSPAESPANMVSLNIPTLTPTPHRKAATTKPSLGTMNKISGYWSSLRSRAGGSQSHLYNVDQVHDSAEDLREMIEQQDREADRLENVRACCDGKHDVTIIPHSSKRGRHSHGHPTNSAQNTPSASARSRA